MEVLSPLENVALGVTAGTLEVFLQQPMLFFKNASQQRLPLTLDPRVLYRGLTMSVVNMSVLTGVQFPLAGFVQHLLTGGVERPLTPVEQVGAGFAGGAMSGVVCAPMELVMIQQQRFGEPNLLRVAARIVQEHGVTTLFRGLIMSSGREGLFCAGFLGMGPVFSETLQTKYGVKGQLGSFLGACGAGVIAATLSHPLDTIKTCMQGDIQQVKFGGVQSTAITLLREEQISRFFAGWGWRTGRMCGAIFIIGQCKDRLTAMLYGNRAGAQ